jgi:hypothetical protein
MRHTLQAILAIAAAASGAARAQSPNVGELVRVTAPAAGLTNVAATLLAATRDSIVVARYQLRSDGESWRTDTTRIAVGLGAIRSLEVQRSRSHVAEGALIGGAGMALMTFAMAKAMECNSGKWQVMCVEPGRATEAALQGGAVGLGLGALVGILWRSQEWQMVPVEPLRGLAVAVAARRGRLGVGLSLAF